MQREPEIAAEAALYPFMCMCGNGNGPFVDLFIEDEGRHLYLCVERCSVSVARALKWSPPEDVDKLVERLAVAADVVQALNDEVEYEREHKLLTVSDALKLADRRTKPAAKSAA